MVEMRLVRLERGMVLHAGWILLFATLCGVMHHPASAGTRERWSCGRATLAGLRDVVQPFDPKSGADANRFPADRIVDFRHLKLELHFDDLTARSFRGRASLTVRPVTGTIRWLVLDAVDLYIDGVVADGGVELHYQHDARKLVLEFDRPLPVDRDTTISIDYRCVKPVEGMYFALPDDAYPNRSLAIHTQGEAEFSRYWFPCLDAPVDRCTTEIVVTVPAPYLTISNGRLVETRRDEQAGTITYHWRQDVPHVFYLVSLIIGEFDVIEDHWGDVPVNYYVPPGRRDDGVRTYSRTPEMMEFFSALLAEDYPYSKYAQTNVHLFAWGGMENTSATTMTDTALIDERAELDNDEESLIAHELVHQWFGDLITCASWDHLWLNEGFATFLATVWTEESQGTDAYSVETWQRMQGVASADSSDTGATLVFRDYASTEDIFGVKGSLPYSKGGSVLHMLRHQLGDELFWKAVQTYLDRFRGRLAETDDLRQVIEDVTGRSFEQFFTQWTRRPGVPELDVKYRWDAKHDLAELTVKQMQSIDRRRPAFAFPLDVYFRCGDQEIRRTINVTERETSIRVPLPAEPDLYCVDPSSGVLASLKCTKSPAMWITQLQRGPTIVTRLRAMRHLSTTGEGVRSYKPQGDEAEGAVPILKTIASLADVLDDANEHWELRAAAADALGELDQPLAMDRLIGALTDNDGLTDPYVRAATVGGLVDYAHEQQAAEVLKRFARSDPSINVEAAAIDALPRIHDEESILILLDKVHSDSYGQTVRRAALEGLIEFGDPRGLQPALHYAAYGQHSRLRPRAIRAVGRLGVLPDLGDQAREALIGWLSDPQRRTVRAAIDALAIIDDSESRAALEGLRHAALDGETRATLQNALGRMDGKPDALGPTQMLERAVRTLKGALSELSDRVDELESHQPTDAS